MKALRSRARRLLGAGAPLAITIVLHLVLAAVAGYLVVSEQASGKKKSFEAAREGNSATRREVEHRLQIARRSGGSSGASPVSAARIFSAAQNSLQLPPLPELPQTGASGFGTFSASAFGGSSGAFGEGKGLSTSLGNTASGGRGFMSVSFLGLTNQKVGNVVFVADIGTSLLDIRKGGFHAFEILRQEISRLVASLPPSSRFNTVFFEGDQVRLFAAEPQPATSANKTRFLEWIRPVNTELDRLGLRSIPADSVRWSPRADDTLKLDPAYAPPAWLQALRAALEQKPDTVFLITGSGALGSKKKDEAEIQRHRRESERALEALRKEGYDFDAISAARGKALAKLRADLDEINRQLVAQKKEPLVASRIDRALEADFQAAVKRAGFTLRLDPTGWTDKNGRLIWNEFFVKTVDYSDAAITDLTAHVARLQDKLLRERAALNLFLFLGPDETAEDARKNLSLLATRHSGKMTVLTARRLEELAGATTASASK